jgi:hypothetical protein
MCGFWGTDLKKIKIPWSVEFLGTKCFYGCESLSEVIFDGHVDVIEEDAFHNCPVKYVEVGCGVNVNYAFPTECRIKDNERYLVNKIY